MDSSLFYFNLLKTQNCLRNHLKNHDLGGYSVGIQQQIVGTRFIVAYENRMAYKIPCTSCFTQGLSLIIVQTRRIGENRCFTDECRGPTERGENFDLQRAQKGPQKPTKGGGCCNKSYLACGVFKN